MKQLVATSYWFIKINIFLYKIQQYFLYNTCVIMNYEIKKAIFCLQYELEIS